MKMNMNNNRSLPRRAFLEKAATITAIGFAAPHLASAADPTPAASPRPNSRIHLGIIGCGHMGRANLTNCAAHPDVVVTAACDVDENRLESTVEQYKATCRGFRDYREMLQSKDLDAVIIATLPHWHALQAIAACEAGKDLYIQKPMTLHLAESLAVRNAVKKHNRISQVGTQHHAREEHHRVIEYVRSGNLGPIGVARTFNVMNQTPGGIGTGGYQKPPEGLDWDLWCGPGPLGRYNRKLAADAYHHCSWMDYSGGWTPGNGPHMIDLPITALDLGYPIVTSASGGRLVIQDDGDAYDHHEVLWRYPNLTLTWMSSLTNSYDFLMKLFGLSLDLDELQKKNGVNAYRYLWPEISFFQLVGGLKKQGNMLYLTPKGQYYWVLMMREFFIGVNNFRDFCRGEARINL